MKNSITLMVVGVALVLSGNLRGATPVNVSSPNGKIQAAILVNAAGRLCYTLVRNETVVLEESPLGITVGATDLGDGVTMGESSRNTINGTYAWRGVKAEVINHCNEVNIPLTHTASKTQWAIQARAYDDGFAFRYIVPGEGHRHVSKEATSWKLPPETKIWFTANTRCYEGVFEKYPVEQVSGIMGFPVTIVLPDNTYAAITEADVMHYSGMVLQGTKTQTLKGVCNDDPNGWEMDGEIHSPWRITMTGPDLNALVNCDIVHNVCPPPDKALFPEGTQTKWLKPGRSLWQWWAYNNEGTHWSKQKEFVDRAAELGLEYYLVDEGWEHPRQQWFKPGETAWPRMKELCDYAKTRGVGIWAWRAWNRSKNIKKQWAGLETVEKREEFFGNCARVGVVGVKIDFMESESHDRLAFYQDCLRVGAAHKIMINFHGANKPAGESRTWPNEMTREGIMGLEYNKWSRVEPNHYAAAPFVRFLAGSGDVTLVTMQKNMLKGTTLALQLAASVVLTSPFLCFADKPDLYLQSNIAGFIRELPATWDETVVLPDSDIGKLAAFARRKGDTWYVAVINGETKAKEYSIDLSFLGSGTGSAVYYEDSTEEAAVEIRKAEAEKGDTLKIKMASGGGFVGVIKN